MASSRTWLSRPALAVAMVFAAVAVAQSPVAAPPASRATAGSSGASPTPGATAISAETLAALGESPIASVLSAVGPDVREYHLHITTLANPFFEGRVPGSRGNRYAADYIEMNFRAAGLVPAFGATEKAADGTEVITLNSSYRQAFQAYTELNVVEQSLRFDLGGKGEMALAPERDAVALGFSGSGRVSGPVVFVGYGIDDAEQKYTTFAEGTDLSEKIALVLRFEPMNADGKSLWTKDGTWSPAASLDGKLQEIAARRAAGIILVNPPGAADPRAKRLSTARETRGSGRTIPIMMATTEAVDRLVRASEGGPTLRDLRERADREGVVVDLAGVSATMSTKLSIDPVMTDNVGGVLRGKGALADEYVVMGAHYDHVGMGPIGASPENIGKLHPGADDNGSGTVGILMSAARLARAYADLPEGASARSVLFLAFSAEEAGLIGSDYFVKHPSIPLERVYAMLNMDMIGRLRNGEVDVEGTESGEGFYDLIKPLLDSSGLSIKHGSTISNNSDHASFYRKKLPVLFFFTGLHREYHTPADQAHTVNHVGAVKVLTLASDIALALAQRPEPLKFTPRRPAQPKAGEQAPDPHAAADPAANPGPTRGRVRFGIAPGNYSDDKPGIEVADVYEGTSADDAGIKVGDRLIRWQGKEITGVAPWMEMMAACKPGDVVEVVVLRDGKELPIQVTLKARTQGDR
ncbi:MAG: M28 family peptidase [Phycisphaerae bacterium]|nr:M28 family peptidase [Phycisphaerae bacterium]